MKASPVLCVTLFTISLHPSLCHILPQFFYGDLLPGFLSPLCHDASLSPCSFVTISPQHPLWFSLVVRQPLLFSGLCGLYSSGLLQQQEEEPVLKADRFPQEIHLNTALIRTNCHLISVLLSGVFVSVRLWKHKRAIKLTKARVIVSMRLRERRTFPVWNPDFLVSIKHLVRVKCLQKSLVFMCVCERCFGILSWAAQLMC